MSKYSKGYMGDQIGKLGTAVGYRWKGRSVMRSYQKYVSNPRTPKQMIVRSRFKRLITLNRAFHWGSKVGLSAAASAMGITEGNLFVHLNWPNVTAVSPDDVTVNYSSLKLSLGDLPEATFGAVNFGSGSHLHIEAPLTGGADQFGADENDDVYLFAYCPELNQGAIGSAAKRTAEKVSVNVPASWDGMEVYVYGFAVGGKEGLNLGLTSRTAYCGSGEVV